MFRKGTWRRWHASKTSDNILNFQEEYKVNKFILRRSQQVLDWIVFVHKHSEWSTEIWRNRIDTKNILHCCCKSNTNQNDNKRQMSQHFYRQQLWIIPKQYDLRTSNCTSKWYDEKKLGLVCYIYLLCQTLAAHRKKMLNTHSLSLIYLFIPSFQQGASFSWNKTDFRNAKPLFLIWLSVWYGSQNTWK